MIEMQPWQVDAINLPEHADNAVHTEAGARAAGFPRALVAGTTVYVALAHPAIAALGAPWVARGGATVRFHHPVGADARIDVEVDGSALVAGVGGTTAARLVVDRSPVPPPPAVGERLDRLVIDVDDSLSGYAERAGDPEVMAGAPDAPADWGAVHPVIWPIIGNRATIATCVDGPWVHVGSTIVHLDTVQPGDQLDVDVHLDRRFDSRSGERVVLDVRVGRAGRPVAVVSHESIVVLR